MKLILLIVLLSTNAFASKAQFLPFFDSLEDRYLMRTDHLIDISNKIRLKKFGIFGNRNAEATYSPFTNTISLKDTYLVKASRGYRIKTYEEFNLNMSYSIFSARANTIFHELSHADFDVMIEKDQNHPMFKLLTRELPAWFKRHHSGANSKTATHELFGYTAGDYIFDLNSKIQDLLMHHGVFYDEDKCFSQLVLKKIAKRLNLTRPLKFQDTLGNIDFKKTIVPKNIFIDGKSLDIGKLPDRFKRKLVYYFGNTYSLPLSSVELADKLTRSHFLQKLQKCYDFLPLKSK